MANWLGEKLEDRDGFIPKTMLSVPIFNGARDVIGVAQLINKVRIVNRRILHAIEGSIMHRITKFSDFHINVEIDI